jgi:hypothetical protein
MATSQQTHETAWSARLAFELTGNDQTVRALVAGLSEEQLNWQPVAGAWSIGQCLEHLCITNEKYLSAMAAGLAGKADAPVEEIRPGWVSRWFLKNFVEPSPNGRRVPAPGKIRPGARVSVAVVERFLASNKACRELIVQARSKDVNRVRFWNPLAPGVRFTVGVGFEIIASHEQRHLLQAERVKDSANFPR